MIISTAAVAAGVGVAAAAVSAVCRTGQFVVSQQGLCRTRTACPMAA